MKMTRPAPNGLCMLDTLELVLSKIEADDLAVKLAAHMRQLARRSE
jgi:hypothetical protein